MGCGASAQANAPAASSAPAAGTSEKPAASAPAQANGGAAAEPAPGGQPAAAGGAAKPAESPAPAAAPAAEPAPAPAPAPASAPAATPDGTTRETEATPAAGTSPPAAEPTPAAAGEAPAAAEQPAAAAPAAKPPEEAAEQPPTAAVPAASPPAPAMTGKWWEIQLPDTPVVRKEIRLMPAAEQERFAAAVMKMRENDEGRPGSSQYFRLAVIHGGMDPLPQDKYPEYCAHRRECFPTWHRPYLVDFEQTMRKADMALGGDGNIGLPYWDWTQLEVNDEVLPRIVREKLMVEFEPEFFGDGEKMITPWPGRHGYKMSATRDDSGIRRLLQSSDVAGLASRSLHSLRHSQHATTAFSNSRFVSLESPHNSVHGIVSGIMSSFQSSFHPSFWLHHCNVDRFYEKYIALEDDSASEFQRHQQALNPQPAAGFPDGPWGRYEPFRHPKTGEPFHARDCFDISGLGYSYDKLPPVEAPQMREPPFFAYFKGVDIRKMEFPRLLYVFVAAKGEEWSAPTGDPTEASSFAGCGSIFFFDTPGGCANCKINPITDIYVDVTAALRKNRLRPAKTELHVLVEDASLALIPLSESPVPPPVLKGPRFSSMEELLQMGQKPGDEAEDDVKMLQSVLVEAGVADESTVGGNVSNPDGDFGPKTDAATRKLQHMAGLKEDGVVGPVTKKALLTRLGLLKDSDQKDKLQVKAGEPVKWKLESAGIPKQLKAQAVAAEIGQAFAQWGEALGVSFVLLEDGSTEDAQVTISFGKTGSDDVVFDGPGGALANASSSAITFDSNERWELQSAAHPHRKFMDWDEQYFLVLPVALHEIGHVLGLGHSEEPVDVMSPFYLRDRVRLSDGDIAAVKAIQGIA